MFPPPVGQLEAFHTGGGISTLPWPTRARSARWSSRRCAPGATSASCGRSGELGLLDLTPVKVKGKEVVSTRRVHRHGVPQAHEPGGATWSHCGSEWGKNGSRLRGQLLDYSMKRTASAEMRTTGTARHHRPHEVDGRIASGACALRRRRCAFGEYVAELAKRGVRNPGDLVRPHRLNRSRPFMPFWVTHE